VASDPDGEFGQLRIEPLGLAAARVPLRIGLLESPGEPLPPPRSEQMRLEDSITRATARSSLT